MKSPKRSRHSSSTSRDSGINRTSTTLACSLKANDQLFKNQTTIKKSGIVISKSFLMHCEACKKRFQSKCFPFVTPIEKRSWCLS